MSIQKIIHEAIGEDIQPHNHKDCSSSDECTRFTTYECHTNRVLADLRAKAPDIEKKIVEAIQNSKGYVAKLPEIDPSLGELEDNDINFVEHKYGQIIFKAEIIKNLTS